MVKYCQRGLIFMKKIIILLVAFMLSGCSSPKSTETKVTPTQTELEMTEVYTIDNRLEFEMIKTSLTDEIAPANKNRTYQYLKPADNQHIFIDIIVRTHNLSENEYELSDLYSGNIELNNEKHDVQLAIESIHYTQMSTTDTLKPQEERYIHLYCEVAKNNTKQQAQLDLQVMNQKDYQYTFSLEEVQEDNQVKSIGDVINCSNLQITILDCQESERIEPSQKGFFYSYHPTDHEDQIFVVLSLEIQNQSSLDIDPAEYIYCEYQMNDEIIHSQIILESEDHQSISESGSILAGQTRTLYLAMPILKTQADTEGTMTLFVEGDVFEIYQSQN